MLKYTKHERVSLKRHAELGEQWLQNKISEDPSILGLGDLILLDRERNQGNAGRLDFLLSDPDEDRRYEVEVMLGATDPSHVIRTIEYWDIERRRYPAYEHVAVLVAEDVTARFLNVLSLFSGSIPLMAIQLNALKINDQVLLDFVKVLDQTELRVDEEEEAEAKVPADRSYWENRTSPDVVSLIDPLVEIINEVATKKQQINYNRSFVGLTDGFRSRNFVIFDPRKRHLQIGAEITDKDTWVGKAEELGLEAKARPRKVWIKIFKKDFEARKAFLTSLLHQAVKEYEE